MRQLAWIIGQAAASTALLALPALARPQWIPVSADEKTYLDYNSVRGTGRVRSATVSFPRDDDNGSDAVTMHIDCSRWMFSISMVVDQSDYTTKWEPIGRGTVGETSAEMICPR